jgi:D-alanyl-D-alanine carboxypeptidase (penicillin-binding protein 5/6)
MKRFLSAAFCLLFFCSLLPVSSRAEAIDFESIPTPNILVVDANDPSYVIYERNADQRAFPASTTKIMTCILAIEAGDLDAPVTVGDEVTPFTNYSSLMGLKSGETVTMRDLIYGLMLPSGNDAGAAIAVHVAGSIDAFVSLMNQKAAQLGMTGTHFTNPHGVHNDNHYSTARDLAKLITYAEQNEIFREVDRTTAYTVPANSVRTEPLELASTNRLIRKVEGDPVDTVYPYCTGGKTGDTDMAGKCLVATAERDGACVIVVLLGDKASMYKDDKVTTNLARFVNAKAIFESVFENNYTAIPVSSLGLPTSFAVDVENANPSDLSDGHLPLTAQLESSVIRVPLSKASAYTSGQVSYGTEYSIMDPLLAPINAGQSVGTVTYLAEGHPICTAQLLAANTVSVRISNENPVPAESPGDVIHPSDTPLIGKGRRIWDAKDVLLVIAGLLFVLLIALILIFIRTEQRRKYERRRRAMRARSQNAAGTGHTRNPRYR